MAGSACLALAHTVGPNVHGRVVDAHTLFLQAFFNIAVAQGVAERPPHGAEADLGFKMASLTEGAIAHDTSPVIRGQQ